MLQMFSYLMNGDFKTFFLLVFVKAYILLCVLPIHEYAHAFAAVKLGDDTPRLNGRLTINPFAHLDLFGSLMILFTGFGYAKPVPVNIRNFRKPKQGFALVAAAGPISNLIMAYLYFVLSNICYLPKLTVFTILSSFFYYVGLINVNLAVFNLLPIPPLDGSRLITVIIPNKYYYKILRYERYIMIALLVLMFTGALSTPLSYLTGFCAKGINYLASLPFLLFK